MARKDRWEIEMVKRRVQTRLECKQTGSEAWLGGSRCPLSDECPGLTRALDYVRPDDCLVVWKLDQLGHSLPHLLGIVTNLQTRGVAFRSLTE